MPVKTKQQAPPDSVQAGPRLVYWISLQEAESRFEVSHSELVRAVQSGDLQSRRILCSDELVVAVSSTELDRDYVRRELARTRSSEESPRSSTAPSLADVALRVELEAERVARARLEGQLETSVRVERSLQRYADRLERELQEARQQAMTLARALGRAEQLAASAQEQLAAPRPARSERPQRRRWKLWS
jgi:hypothetical protein